MFPTGVVPLGGSWLLSALLMVPALAGSKIRFAAGMVQRLSVQFAVPMSILKADALTVPMSLSTQIMVDATTSCRQATLVPVLEMLQFSTRPVVFLTSIP